MQWKGGFLVGWNMWLNMVAILSYVGIQSATMLAYVLGPQAAWVAESKWAMGTATWLILGSLMLVAFIGLGLGKWVQDLGGAVMVIVFLALIALPFRNHLLGRPAEHPPLALSLPALSLLSVNLIGKMSFGALSGFDSLAIFAGECRDAAKEIGRSVIIAAPVIAGMYVLGSSAVVALVPLERIDLISPISQALTLGTRPGDPGAALIPLAIAAMLFSFVAAMALTFTYATRLPMVAGWDDLLPAWFGRLHPRRKTPVNSILFVGAVAFVMAMAGVAGAGQQEAFQLLQNAAGIFYAFAYLAMFALPLAGRQRQIARPALWLRAAAVSGFATTAMYLVLSLFPIIDVPKPLAFTAKVGGFVLACQLVAGALYYAHRRKARAAAAVARGDAAL
jgi:amino acid transporter